jgi:hypothetical protein
LHAAYTIKGWSTADLDKTAEQCVREGKDPAKASQKGEGCNVDGYLEVNKVAGNFHVALGKSKSVDGRLIHEFNPIDAEDYNTSHYIKHLTFGDTYPGQQNPLDGRTQIVDGHKSATGVYQYFVKVVPTVFRDTWGNEKRTNDFAFTEKFTPVGEAKDAKHDEHHAHHGHGHRHPQYISALPGVFFVYEMSPFLVVKETERYAPHQLLLQAH